METAAIDEIRDRVLTAGRTGVPLRLRGGGTKDWYGEEPTGDILDTRAHAGITSYDPAELVLTARCGTPLADIEAVLAEKHQMLPFEPPHFGPGATFGGCIATGLSGPRRASSGAARDFTLGAAVMNGNGEVLHFGGQVMKNVAGYDVARLMTGSLGTLALILEASVKVLPRPFSETTLKFDMDAIDAVRRLNEWAGRPLPLSASAWRDGTLAIRLSGAEAAVKAARNALGGEVVDPVGAARFWEGLREQSDAFFTSLPRGHALWRLSVPAVTEPSQLPGPQWMEWGGAQRWWVTDADAAAVRKLAHGAGGHATLYRPGPQRAGVFTPLPEPVMAIHRRLKESFDPTGIFNPGRMYAGL
jgi:glycolate oxidase FAD binding subunit